MPIRGKKVASVVYQKQDALDFPHHSIYDEHRLLYQAI
jgi:hypothetical protein